MDASAGSRFHPVAELPARTGKLLRCFHLLRLPPRPTTCCLPLVSGKAFLAPLAHDEWPIYFSMWEGIFSLPRALIFNTPTEQRVSQKRFPGLTLSGPTIGVGIESPGKATEEFRTRYGLDEPFLLYLGRIDESKGCAEMIAYFVEGRRDGMIKSKLSAGWARK